MTDKTKKKIQVCSIIALVMCFLWALYNAMVFIGLLTGLGGVSEKANWSDNNSLKIVYFIIYFCSTVVLIGMCIKVIVNTLRGLHEHVAFPQNNVKPLFWLAAASFVYMLCWVNQPLLHKDYFVFKFAGANFILPFLLLFFAFMYKVAADAVEENNLTI